VEEAGVDGGGAADGEVGAAAAEAPVVARQERRDERQAQALGCAGAYEYLISADQGSAKRRRGAAMRVERRRTDEVDGEAAVGLAPGGAAEEGGAVGRAHDGVEEGAPAERDWVVSGVRVRVAEDEDGVVPPPGCCCWLRRRRREHDGEEERGGARREQRGGHAGRAFNARAGRD
jgi:hypothetical protein